MEHDGIFPQRSAHVEFFIIKAILHGGGKIPGALFSLLMMITPDIYHI